jgi:hypothetical protein
MRSLPLLCLLLATSAWGQQEPPQSNVPPEYRPPIARENDEPKALSPSAAAVEPDATVITIKGVCAQMAPSTASAADPSCQTRITRAQFERLTDAILTHMKPSMQKEVANSYPDLLAMAREAEARGVEKTPRFEDRLAFARMQILSQELIREFDEEAAKIPEKDIFNYYRDHADLFQQATLERIFIPRQERKNPFVKEKATPDELSARRKQTENAMNLEAQQIRVRAAAGEDFLKLQKDAYAAAGLTDVPPNPSLGQLRSINLPASHAAAFDLKPGEVSQILSDSSGHYIYKCDAKKIETLDEAKAQIRKALQSQRREEAIQAVQRPVTAEFNQTYFGTTEKPSMPPGSSRSK